MEFLFRTHAEATSFGEANVAEDEDVATFTVTPVGKQFRVDLFEEDGYRINESIGPCRQAIYL